MGRGVCQGERVEARGGGALRGPQVSRGVYEMTVADLGGISPFSLTYTPGLAQTETRGGRGDSEGGEGGFTARALLTTRDLPACLLFSLYADPCHPLQTGELLFLFIHFSLGKK